MTWEEESREIRKAGTPVARRGQSHVASLVIRPWNAETTHHPQIFLSQHWGPGNLQIPLPRPWPQHLLATFSTSCPPARLPRGCTVMTTPSVSQSCAEAPATSSDSSWMPSRPCSSAMSCSWDGVLLRVAGSSRRRGEGSRDMGWTWPVSRLLLITERIWGWRAKLSPSHSRQGLMVFSSH